MASELVTLSQEKMLNSLPNEMLRTVLDKLDVTELIGIRGVCKGWMVLIEDICQEKRSIVIVAKCGSFVNSHDVSNCFNGLVHSNQNCVTLNVNSKEFSKISLTTDFCVLLVKLFPRVENLFIMSHLVLTAGTAQNLISLLNKWSSTIVNLHLPSFFTLLDLPESLHVGLCDQIDNLTVLKRLVVPNVDCLKPSTAARLEHCSFDVDYLLEIVPHLGTSCTSLTLFGHVSLDALTQMRKLNAPLVESVTRLSFVTEKQALSFICSNFMALKMLDLDFYYSKVFDADTIAHLARLSNLSQLTIKPLEIALPTLAWSTNLPTLNSIQSLSMPHFNVRNEGQPFSGYQFCRIVSRIFPNLQQLTIKHEDWLVRDGIALHLNLFGYLRKHVIVPAVGLCNTYTNITPQLFWFCSSN